MKFGNINLVTDDVFRLRAFYEKLFDAAAEGDEVHSFVYAPGVGIAIYNKKNAIADSPCMNYRTGCNDSFCISFDCDDAEVEHQRIIGFGIAKPNQPEVMPWGAKRFFVRDPDGNAIIIRSWPKETR